MLSTLTSLYHTLLAAIGLLETHLAHFLVAHPVAGVVVLMLLVALESVPFFGNFMLGSVLLVAAGALVEQGQLNFWAVLIPGLLGAVLGEGVMYQLGLYGHRQLLHTRFFRRYQSGLTKTQHWFDRYGGWAVFICRFPPGVHAFIAVIAGVNVLPARKFYPAALLSALVWTPPHLLIGMFTLDKML